MFESPSSCKLGTKVPSSARGGRALWGGEKREGPLDAAPSSKGMAPGPFSPPLYPPIQGIGKGGDERGGEWGGKGGGQLRWVYQSVPSVGGDASLVCRRQTRTLGRTYSVSTKLAMSHSSPNSIKIEVTDLELNIKTIYHSISAAAKVLNINEKNIQRYLKYQKPYAGRYLLFS
nr:hypothetical protein [Morchella crassipes]